MTENIFCETCSKAGSSSRMSLYQINMEEAILMCENTECVFTIDEKGARLKDFIVSRKAEDIFKWRNKLKKCISNQKIQLPVQRCEKVIQWENIDALCWLNSALSLLVHNNTIKQLISKVQTSENSLLKCLVEQHAKAQYLSEFDLTNAKKVLEDIRNLVWEFLCPKMKCTLGINDSPLFALLLLLKENSITADKCIQEYSCEFCCQICKHTETTRHRKPIVTLPNTPENFNLQQPSFQRTCNNCNAKNQCSQVILERVPDVLFFHFVEGLHSTDYLDYKVDHENSSYRLTQFIQYIHDPDHFICWTKQNDGPRWLDLDDLKPSLHSWSDSPPKVPPSQVHIIVLQRVSTTCINSSVNQNVDTIQTDASFTSPTHAETSLQETKTDSTVKKELESNLKVFSDGRETPTKNSFVDCNSNRFPFKDLNTPNCTVHAPSTLNKSLSERQCSPSSSLNSPRALQYRVKLKRLSSGIQFQPFLPKNPRTLLNGFQPYVPKKDRTALLVGEKNCEDIQSPSSPTLLNSPGDSGYSSPSSVSSCSSSTTCNKEESIADQLEKLLPDCLENAAPIKDMSKSQDDFIQQLLFNE